MVSVMRLPRVHPVVDKRIDHGVGHGEPVEGQVHVLDVLGVGEIAVVVGVQEVRVVGQPADAENRHHHYEHSHHLKMKRNICETSSRKSI